MHRISREFYSRLFYFSCYLASMKIDSNTIEYVDIGEDFDYDDISNINRFIVYITENVFS